MSFTNDDLAKQVGFLTMNLWALAKERDELAQRLAHLEKQDAPVQSPE